MLPFKKQKKERLRILRKINPKMVLANVSSRHGELVETKYGKSPVGSLSSFQLSHTE